MRINPLVLPLVVALVAQGVWLASPCWGGSASAPSPAEGRLAAGTEQMAAGDLDAAQVSLEGALAAFRAENDRLGEARALKELGNLWYSRGNPEKAIEIEQQALALAREVGDRDLQARLLNNLGLALQVTDAEAAYCSFERSLEVARAGGIALVEALALANLADLDRARGNAVQALLRLEQAADQTGRFDLPGLAVRVLSSLAELYHELGAPLSSAARYEEALSYVGPTGNRLAEASLWIARGMELQAAGQSAEAQAALRQGLAIAEELGNLETMAAALQGLALAAEERRDAAEETATAERLGAVGSQMGAEGDAFRRAAERHLQEARSRTEAAEAAARLRQDRTAALARGDRASAAMAGLTLAGSLLQGREMSEAVETLGETLALFGEIGEREGQRVALKTLVRLAPQILQEKPELQAALLQQMAQVAGELGIPEAEGTLQAMLGMTWFELGEPRRAIEPLERAVALLETAGQGDLALTAQEALVSTFVKLGDLAAAERSAAKLLARARSSEDRLREGIALHELARKPREDGDLPRALSLLEQSLASFEKVPGAELRRAQALQTLGTVRYEIGDSLGALKVFEDMGIAARAAREPELAALALYHQSLLSLELGDPETAERLLAAGSLLGRNLGKPGLESLALSVVGFVSWSGDRGRALESWQRLSDRLASSTDDPGMRAIAEGLLARGFADLGETGRAFEHASRSMLAAEASRDDADLAIAFDHRAYVHFRAGHLPEAERDAREAIRRFEARRTPAEVSELAAVSSLDRVLAAYELLLKILSLQDRPGAALETAERGRGQALLRALDGGADAPVTPRGLEAFETTARDLGVTLVEYAILYDPATSFTPARFEGLQDFYEDELLIWVIPPEGGVQSRSVNLAALRKGEAGETLGQRIRFLQNLIERAPADREDPALRARLRDLHDLLIAPIAGLLPRDPAQPVVLVPHGALFLVPFATLLDPDGRYLIERHPLLTVPSLESLRELAASPPAEGAGRPALVVGDPATSPRAGALPRLPYAEREAREVARILGVEALLGSAATEPAVVQALPRARLIHLASHGLLERGSRQVPGALALAPAAEEDDGLLTAAEIRELDLDADLVVLSACRTGLGRITGDGVLGLSRSVLAAGARGVVMSLWRIDDQETETLMVGFHRHLAAAGDPARALRQAMLEAIGRGASPRFWGAFTYLGAPRRRS